MEEPEAGSPAPGWYQDPGDPSSNRYWDGAQWTDGRAPREGAGDSGGKETRATGIVIAGYIFAVLIPIIGLIIGLTQISKNRHGIWIVVVALAIIALFVSAQLIGSSGNSGV